MCVFDSSHRNIWWMIPAAERFHILAVNEAGGGAMIDLSHLTEEEQGKIMTVLKRDTDLKQAEEERIRWRNTRLLQLTITFWKLIIVTLHELKMLCGNIKANVMLFN